MNRFLTRKALRIHWLDWPIMFYSYLIGFCSIAVLLDYLKDREFSMFILGFVFAAVSLAPGVLITRRRWLTKRAKEFARALMLCKRSEISFGDLAVLVPKKEPVQLLQKVLRADLMTNLYVDLLSQKIVMDGVVDPSTAPAAAIPAQPELAPKAEPLTAAIKCPSCGAGNHVVQGKLCHCDFCGSPLPFPKDLVS